MKNYNIIQSTPSGINTFVFSSVHDLAWVKANMDFVCKGVGMKYEEIDCIEITEIIPDKIDRALYKLIHNTPENTHVYLFYSGQELDWLEENLEFICTNLSIEYDENTSYEILAVDLESIPTI